MAQATSLFVTGVPKSAFFLDTDPAFVYNYHCYKGELMSTQHEQIVAAFNTYLAENEKFTQKGVKASAARARHGADAVPARVPQSVGCARDVRAAGPGRAGEDTSRRRTRQRDPAGTIDPQVRIRRGTDRHACPVWNGIQKAIR